MPSEEAQRVFRQIDTTGRGYITFGKCILHAHIHTAAMCEPTSVQTKEN